MLQTAAQLCRVGYGAIGKGGQVVRQLGGDKIICRKSQKHLPGSSGVKRQLHAGAYAHLKAFWAVIDHICEKTFLRYQRSMAGFARLFGDLGKEAAHPVANGDGGIAYLGQPDHLWAEPVATGFCVLFK